MTFGADCLLCGSPAQAVACRACACALPRTETACLRCALPMPVAGEICGRCLREPPAFDAAVAAYEYRFPVDRLVQRFKFSGDLATGRWLGMQLAQCVNGIARPALLVVPALTRSRLRQRGFNQALELARVVGGGIGVHVASRAVVKVRETQSQPGLGAGARHDNLRDAFRCDLALAGRDVAIVDDVMTTGATADAVAHALKRAGAGRVSVWVAARTPEPRR